jgi:hypothetical protein
MQGWIRIAALVVWMAPSGANAQFPMLRNWPGDFP